MVALNGNKGISNQLSNGDGAGGTPVWTDSAGAAITLPTASEHPAGLARIQQRIEIMDRLGRGRPNQEFLSGPYSVADVHRDANNQPDHIEIRFPGDRGKSLICQRLGFGDRWAITRYQGWEQDHTYARGRFDIVEGRLSFHAEKEAGLKN